MMSDEAGMTRKGTQRLSNFLNDVDRCVLEIFGDIGHETLKQLCTKTLRLRDSPPDGRPTKFKDRTTTLLRNEILSSSVKTVRFDLSDALGNFQVETKLQTLCELEEKYQDRKENAWRPPYDPEEHCRSGRVAATKSNLQTLEVLRSLKRQSIDQLKTEIRKVEALLEIKSASEKRIQQKLDSFEKSSDRVENVLADKINQIGIILDS